MGLPFGENLPARLATEFFGTFFLILVICLSTTPAASMSMMCPAVGAPLAIGSILMVCVYCGGHVSGAHYNPAVTLSVLLAGRDKIKPLDALMYMLSQFIASVVGAWMAFGITGYTTGLGRGANITEEGAFLAEFLYTFMLSIVVLQVATVSATEYYGIAIGYTVLGAAIAVGPVSGGAFNPAVGWGPMIINAMHENPQPASPAWLYTFAPFLGAAFASLCFRFTYWTEKLTEGIEFKTRPGKGGKVSKVAGANKLVLPEKLFYEFIGTFFLVYTVCTATTVPKACGGIAGPLGIGCVLMALVYMGGGVSGGHYNPAVTIGLFLSGRGRIGVMELGSYCGIQCFAAMLAAFAGGATTGVYKDLHIGLDATTGTYLIAPSLFAEMIFTFLLVYVVLNVATATNLKGNGFYGISIGFVVVSGALCVGNISGAAFNPAVTFGVTIGSLLAPDSDGGYQFRDFWIYWLGQFLGATVAALLFRAVVVKKPKGVVKPVDAEAPAKAGEAPAKAAEAPAKAGEAPAKAGETELAPGDASDAPVDSNKLPPL